MVTNCQSLITEVFTTSRVYVKPDVGIRATTNQAPLLSSSCCELMSTFLNKTGTQPGNCTLTHSGHKYKPNEPSDCARWPLSQMTRCGHKPNEPSDRARWPLSQMTRCGHKPNEPSDCARWPLSQMTCCGQKRNEPNICIWWRFSKLKRRMNSTVVLLNNPLIVHGLISADCSSGHHDEALTIRNCKKNEKHINDYSVTISEKVESGKKTVKRLRKRDREPSRIPVKRILNGLNKRKFRKRIQSFVRQHLPDSSFMSDLCKNYKTWNIWYITDHSYSKFVFYMKLQKKKCKTREKHCTCSCRQTHNHDVQNLMNFKGDTFTQLHNDNSRLKGGMSLENAVSNDTPLNRLTERLRLIGLIPHDVGGCGDCFFKSVSHQLYRTADLHLEIRMAGINHLQNYPELYIESISDDHWNNYIRQMSKQGTWCDNIIMQAVANAYNCVIHITESNIDSPEGIFLTPVADQVGRKTIFIGYINDFHYVSTVTEKNGQHKNKLRYIKRKLSETNENKQCRHLKHRNYLKRVKYTETANERASKLADKRATYKKNMCEETPEKRKERLANKRDSYRKRMSEETAKKRKERLENKRASYRNEKSETISDGQNKSCANPIHEQKQAQNNMNIFHKSNEFSVSQCTVCFEAWPLKSNPRRANHYQCQRCTRDKQQPKKFSKENDMLPSLVPLQLLGLTQVEEMLIARALPIMRVYIKPGGQRGYSGHVINLPQNIAELAHSLPRYPKDLSVIVVKKKGKDNSFKDVTVRRQNVADALKWLINNNPHYKDININQDSLNSLPEDGVPHDLLSVETENIDETAACEPDLGPQNEDDIVYNEGTEMSSFLPIPDCQAQEIDAVQQQLCHQATMPWPTVDNEPMNEYLTPFLATLAFPTLFPDGKGDPTNPSLRRDIPLGERVKHLLKFGENKNGKWVYRFATHPRFAYWALNMIQRKRILQQTGMFLKQNPGEAHLTAEELRQMAASNNTSVFISKISRYLSNITGSDAYWQKAKEELKAVIAHAGAPTFFFTFSSADMHWPELHALFGNQVGDTDTNLPGNKRQNVINNPHITDWFFTQRLESFIKYWLYNSLNAEWHWYRFEYQARGSIHCHGVAKLKNDPGLCKLSGTTLKGYLAEMSIDKADQTNIPALNQQILEGKKASQAVCQYVDWLLSTYNPNPPDNQTWAKPSIHPCQRRHKDILSPQDFDDDYVDLLNTVQRHTRCSSNYCLRKKQNETELKCRFKFPFEPCLNTKLEFEPIHTKDGNTQYKAKIITKRNDPRLNNHQRFQLQGWRANCDIQVVLDYHACVEYLAKYASKGEPRSPVMKLAFNSIVRNCNNNSNSTKVIKKVIMKSLGQRDFSAQETMHHLMSLKLVSSSFNVVPISLNGSRRIKTYTQDGDNVTNDSLLDTYAKRKKYANTIPDIMALNFIDFATKYKIVNNKLSSQSENIVPRVYPVYSPNKNGQNFGLYCKYQLLRYKPWHTTQENAWGDQEGTDDIYINNWKEFLDTPYAEQHVPDWYEKLHSIQNQPEEQPDTESSTHELPQREEWMVLADLVPGSSVNNNNNMQETQQPECDWQNDKLKYHDHQIGEMPSWIKTKKDTLGPAVMLRQHTSHIDVDTFSDMQRHAYNIVKTHSEQAYPTDPLLLIVLGVAGTGKSYLINAIRNLLQYSCAVTATTGKASYNINGSTIHSLLRLPVGSRGNKQLTGTSLIRLQQNLKDINYIIIDEYSMLGQTMFGWIDRRCRQATGKIDEVFGGKSIILVGDPGQLPPVADKPLYHSSPSSSIGQQGHLAYYMFSNVVKLSVNQRVQGVNPQQTQFRDLLMRLRTGDCNEEDWKLLLTRQPSKAENIAEFQYATRLYFSNEEVANYNFHQLAELHQPIARIDARHSSDLAKKASPDQMSGLEPSIFLSKGAKIMLTMNLWTDVGLCNGATGTVVDFIYANNQQPPDLPVSIIVKFDNYSGPSINDTMPGYVPICPITVTSDTLDGVHERQQLPLKLAWAITIHKSQGLTLPKAWIDIGHTEKTAGISYVAISRVRTLSTCIIEPMTFERLTSLKRSINLKFRLEEERRLNNLSNFN